MAKIKTLLPLVVGVAASINMTGCGSSTPNQVTVTWVAVADWVFDVGDQHVYVDGALTRFDPNNLYGGASHLAYSYEPVCFNKDADQRVLGALEHLPNYHITGHSNLDHSYDTATMAKITNAPIIGSPSTCFQVIAQGIPASRCKVVNGRETIDLGNGVKVHIVHWNHSGSDANPDLHDPKELVKPPTPDANGCYRPGVLEDFPNGGGGRGLLFTAGDSGHQFSWFFTDTGSDYDFEQPIIINPTTGEKDPNGTNYGSPKDNLIAAMSDAGLTSVDLWIGQSNVPLDQKVVPILKPKAFIPNHLGSFYVDFFQGFTAQTGAPYADTAVQNYLSTQNVKVLAPIQYMDAWTLDSTGTVSTPNTTVKQKLGFY